MTHDAIDRRRFLGLGAGALVTAGVAAVGPASAQGAKLDEKDPQAASLGYRHDTTKVDTAKFPKHTAQQQCANCALFQGKAADAWGGCPIFAGRQVSGKGWCSAWQKKA